VLISIVTPTARRPSFLPLLYDCVTAQDWPEWEWLILDSSEAPAPVAFDDPRVRYIHDPVRVSLGEKRNRLAQAARGELIAHFDDDDYYAPSYLSAMVRRLGDAPLVKLTGFFTYRAVERRLAYWNLMVKQGLHHEWFAGHPAAARTYGPEGEDAFRDNHLGYGLSFLYRRAAWETARFEDVAFNEDAAFARALMKTAPIVGFPDTTGLMFAVQHRGNHSKLFPQQLLAPDEMPRLFPAAGRHLQRLHEIVTA
jgi:glycosyltransferase involved in cell wall biosynthesis